MLDKHKLLQPKYCFRYSYMYLCKNEAYKYIKTSMISGGVSMQRKMFLLKNNSGVIYHFYHSPAGGICYKLYSLESNQKIDPFELNITDEKVLEYYVTIDEHDIIHVLCLTANGDLKYFVYKENNWKHKIFSHFDLRSNMIQSLFLHIYDQKLYIIYAASNVMNINLWTIYFKCWDGSKWINNNIGLTICEKEFPAYLIAFDSKNNFHLVYKNSGSKSNQLFYRKFHMQFSLWSTPDKILTIPEQIGYYYLVCDSHDRIHLVWTTATGSNFKIFYRQLNTKILNHKPYERMLTLNTSLSPYLQPVIFEIEENLWVMWKNQQEFWGCLIDSSGLSNSTVSSILHPNSSAAELIEYTNNYTTDKQSFKGQLFYGIAGSFVDLILPQGHTYDFCDYISTNTNDTEPPPNYSPYFKQESTSIPSNAPGNIENMSVKTYETTPIISAETHRLLNELTTQLKNGDIASALEVIKIQNEMLISYLKNSQNNSNEPHLDDRESKWFFRRIFNKMQGK